MDTKTRMLVLNAHWPCIINISSNENNKLQSTFSDYSALSLEDDVVSNYAPHDKEKSNIVQQYCLNT